jgi:hypothetical protein
LLIEPQPAAPAASAKPASDGEKKQ